MSRRRGSSLEFVDGTWNGEHRLFRRGVIIVGFIPHQQADDPSQAAIDAILAAIPGAVLESKSRTRHWFVAKTDEAVDVPATAKDLMQRRDVRYAEPDFHVTGLSPVAGQCGCDWSSRQWGLDAVQAHSASGLEKGKTNVLIGIIDTGVAMVKTAGGAWVIDHEDLDSNRFLGGKNVLAELGLGAGDVDVPDDDDCGHGTFVTGIIAARTAESAAGEVGIRGINRVSPVYSCRVLEGLGFAFAGIDDEDAIIAAAVSLLVTGIEHIVSFAGGVKSGLIAVAEEYRRIDKIVINMSVAIDGTKFPNSHLQDTVQWLKGLGNVIVCCGVGNDGEALELYPAQCSLEYFDTVIGVGGTMLDTSGREVIWPKSNRGKNVTLVAPAFDIWTTALKHQDNGGNDLCYRNGSGTSFATAFVTGIVSLLWSKCPSITAADVVACMKAACENLPATRGENMNSDEWGSGRINAYFAIPDVELVTHNLAFVDAAPGENPSQAILLKIKSCLTLHLHAVEITYDPNPPQNAHFEGTSATYTPGAAGGEYHEFGGLTVRFHGLDHDSFASGRVKITCSEFGPDWSLPVDLTGNTVKSKSHIVLVADKSGSMAQASGIASFTRMEVLSFSAGVLIDYLPIDSAMGIVSFDEDAHTEVGTTVIHAASEANNRDKLRDAVGALVPGGLTSIGDGVELAQTALDGEAGYDNRAIIVLTDGHETAGQYISEVADTITKDVYAIGVGTGSAVNAESLSALTDGHGKGYTLVTGNLDEDSAFKVAKYFLQILADVCNEEVLVDPDGRIRRGTVSRIPFRVTEADARVDVLLMMPPNGIIGLRVEPPSQSSQSGARATIEPVVGVNYFAGSQVTYYRLELPQMINVGTDDAPVQVARHAGTWHAVLHVKDARLDDLLSSLDESSREARMLRHGVPYSLVAHARSDVRMRANLAQDGFEPGSKMTIRAVVMQSRLPLLSNAQVDVEIQYPDGTASTLRLQDGGQGVHELVKTMTMTGVYTCRLVARGLTRSGQAFTREQVRTGVCYHRVSAPVFVGRGPLPT